MARIDIEKIHDGEDASTFRVTVKHDQTTAHTVTVSRHDYESLGAGAESAEGLVRTCMEALLERESQAALLPRMDLREMISSYPSFQESARRGLGRRRAT